MKRSRRFVIAAAALLAAPCAASGCGGRPPAAAALPPAPPPEGSPSTVPAEPADPASSEQPPASPVRRFVRAWSPQLRTCYEERGLKQDPRIVGVVTVAVTVDDGGAITRAAVIQRSWALAGDSATNIAGTAAIGASVEGCALERIGRWRFPPDDVPPGVYEFDFSFRR